MTITAFIDPLAIGLVAGASFAVAWMQNGSAAALCALAALRTELWIKPQAEADDGHRAVLRIEHLVESRGTGCVDRIKQPGFVGSAADAMANQRSLQGFEDAVARLAAQRRTRLATQVRFWDNVADMAPAMGMLGTVTGLIMLFGDVEDAASIGRAMALALLTTLYGLVLANLIAGPIAKRLARIAAEEQSWHDDVARRLIAIGRLAYPDITASGLYVSTEPPRAFKGAAARS
ncbi:MotA/TolQ/ExbB proton channel family protein [Blastomonas sp.]|uniref:MotA/TolQ/ExbB proton channel family protein n=1 Tax=Blastomonas sp. TaxID=1909299 RepID=UPI003593AC41